MRRFLLFFLLFNGIIAFAETPSIHELRAMYYGAPKDKEIADRFLRVMDRIKPDADPILVAYKGMASMLKANHAINPYTKLSYFSKGKVILERAVEVDPNNIEIRFLRFCAQTNAPFFLGYNSKIQADKMVILNFWNKLTDDDLKARIRTYMLASGYCSKNEKAILL